MKHSTEDWDFSSASWELDPVTYHSAPSSLHPLTTALKTYIKTTVVANDKLKEGRFRTYIITLGDVQAYEVRFRYQDEDNYYCIRVNAGENLQQVIRRKAGVETVLRQQTVNWWAKDTWKDLNVYWWESNGVLWIRITSNGTKILPDTSDAQNNWADVGGRLGFGGYSTLLVRVDDTYIYGSP